MWQTLMDQSLTLQRATITQDSGGGSVRALATVLTGVRAAVQSAGANELLYWDRRDIVCEDVVFSVTDFDALLSGGVRLGDVFVDADGVNRAVTGVRKDKNTVLSTDPLYEIATRRVR